ncbi:hypothetical protein NEOC84_000384|nr:hypothetical protein [Neochlamydia sp. AcF84]
MRIKKKFRVSFLAIRIFQVKAKSSTAPGSSSQRKLILFLLKLVFLLKAYDSFFQACMCEG